MKPSRSRGGCGAAVAAAPAGFLGSGEQRRRWFPWGSWCISPARQRARHPCPSLLALAADPPTRWPLVLPARREMAAPAVFLETSGVSPCQTLHVGGCIGTHGCSGEGCLGWQALCVARCNALSWGRSPFSEMLGRGPRSAAGDTREGRLPDRHRLWLMAVLCWNRSALGFNAEMGEIRCRKGGIASAAAKGACFLECLVFCCPYFLLTGKAKRPREAARCTGRRRRLGFAPCFSRAEHERRSFRKAAPSSAAETCRQRSVPAAVTAASPPGSPVLAQPGCPSPPLARAACSACPTARELGWACGAR